MWPAESHYKNCLMAQIKPEFKPEQPKQNPPRLQSNKSYQAPVQQERYKPILHQYVKTPGRERGFPGEAEEERERVTGEDEAILQKKTGIFGQERESTDRMRHHKEGERRHISSRHTGVTGKEGLRRPMARSNHRMGLTSGVRTL